jgi:Protein of unknown function (DUF732)
MTSIGLRGPIMNYRTALPILLVPLAALIRTIALVAGLVVGGVVLSAPAHADDQSYLNYLGQNGIGTSLMNPPTTVALGRIMCDDIRSGMSPADAARLPGGPLAGLIPGLDGAGIVAAAQHELCPDTLH